MKLFFPKSRRDGTLSPLLKGGGGIPPGVCRKVPSLRDSSEEGSHRRLKPTVNKVLSLRDWAHIFTEGELDKKKQFAFFAHSFFRHACILKGVQNETTSMKATDETPKGRMK
jgi:hypothetical protein